MLFLGFKKERQVKLKWEERGMCIPESRNLLPGFTHCDVRKN
jgi:hypothetical protein